MKSSFNKVIFYLSLCALCQGMLQAQSMLGLWEVVEVSVEDKIVTPRERWFRFSDNGIYRSGNGWLQHEKGIYSHDPSDSIFSSIPNSGLKDPYGGFKIWFADEEMHWQRHEDDMKVYVRLVRIDELPISLSDELIGRWKLDSLSSGIENMMEYPDSSHTEILFLRWDKEYRKSNHKGNFDRGYWHLHSHRPELTMISTSNEVSLQVFTATLKDDCLELIVKDENGVIRKRFYHRHR